MSGDDTDEYEDDRDEYESELEQYQVGEEEVEERTIEFYGGKWMSAFPLAFFIVWAIIQTAFFRVGDLTGLVAAILVGLIIGMFFARGSWDDYANTIFEGMTQPVAATAIVAWLWAGMFSEVVQAGGFVEGLVWLADVLGVGSLLFPALTFVLAALLATGIGTGFGTTVAFTTLFFPAGILLGANPVLMFGAILSGATFGDNLAPVSDTTIVSAVTQNADIGGVVATRFKYAVVAAVPAFFLYIFASSILPGADVAGEAASIFVEAAQPAGLVHLISLFAVIGTALAGRHIIEAISWGIIAAVVLNLVLGLAPASHVIVINVPQDVALGQQMSWIPFVQVAEEASVGGAIYTGAAGFFPIIVLVLLIVAAAQIMVRGGGFEAFLEWSLNRVATTVNRAEGTLVLSTLFLNAVFTINTAAEIAIAPYISNLGERYNINGYRRANLLDACTVGIAYIFPWSGAVLLGFGIMTTNLVNDYEWFTQALIVGPADVWWAVFHGWLLSALMIISAFTGFGREYTSDRMPTEVATI